MKKVKEAMNYIIYENKSGNVKLAHFALAFGEPAKVLQIVLAHPDGYYETERHLTPDQALQFALDLMKMAIKVKEKLLRWEVNRTPAY